VTYWHALAALAGLAAYLVTLVAWAHHHDRQGH